MSESDHKKIISSLSYALRPIAKMLLRIGVGYSEFANVAKSVFIQVASEEFGVRGRPTNISRIAAMNGLSRKEVSKLRESSPSQLLELSNSEAPLSLLLHEWVTNPKYTDEGGRPKLLAFSNNDVSFSSLVEDISVDIPPGAIKTELLRVGAISVLEDKRIRLENRSFIPLNSSEKMAIGLSSLHALAATVEHNSDLNRHGPVRIERLAVIDDFPIERVNDAEEQVRYRLEKITEDMDDLLTEEAAKIAASEGKTKLGVGFYYFQIPND